MKPLNVWLLLAAIGITISACQKEIDGTETDPPIDPAVPFCGLTKWIQGTPQGGPDDTVHVFKYDQQGRMHVIIDSGYNDDSRILKYVSGRLSEILYVEKNFPTDTFSIAKYTYTSSGLLKQVESYFATDQKYVFNYGADTLPVSLTFYRENVFSGAIDTLQYRYQWLNGNLVKSEMLDDTTWVTDMELSYTSIPNQAKFVALLDFSEEMLFVIAPVMFFNKNMESNFKSYWGNNWQYYYGYDADYTLDSAGRITNIKHRLNDTGVPFGLSQRHLFYTCK